MADHKPTPVEIQKHLAGVAYPASKETVVDTAKNSNASQDIMSALEGLPDTDFASPAELSKALAG